MRQHVDADAERLQLRHALEHAHGNADLVQAERQRQPANAAARDENGHDTPSRYWSIVMTWEAVSGQPRRPAAAGRGWTAGGAPLTSGFLREDQNVQALLRPRHLRARFAYRPGRSRRRLHAPSGSISRANQQNSPEYLKINPKGRVPALVTDRGILTETPAMLAFIAQSFPQGEAGAARRSLCVRAGAVLQQLSLLHGACRPCPQGARLSLGDRGDPRSPT